MREEWREKSDPEQRIVVRPLLVTDSCLSPMDWMCERWRQGRLDCDTVSIGMSLTEDRAEVEFRPVQTKARS